MCRQDGSSLKTVCMKEKRISSHLRNNPNDYCGACQLEPKASCGGSTPVNLANLPKQCDSSDVISVTLPDAEQTIKVFEATFTTGDFRGEDKRDGSIFQFIRNKDNRLVGSLVDVSAHTVTQFSVDANGKEMTVVTESKDFPPEAEPVEVDTARKLAASQQDVVSPSHI